MPLLRRNSSRAGGDRFAFIDQYGSSYIRALQTGFVCVWEGGGWLLGTAPVRSLSFTETIDERTATDERIVKECASYLISINTATIPFTVGLTLAGGGR